MADSTENTTEETPAAKDPAAGIPPEILEREAPTKKTTEGTEGGEQKIWECSYSGKAMYGTWILLVPITALIVGATIWAMMTYEFISNNSYFVWLGLALVLVLLWGTPLSKLMYKKVSIHYKLTTQRLIHTEGFFFRKTDQIELIDIEDVNYSQSIFQRMFGVGTIIVESSDKSHPILHMEGIDKVSARNDDIDKQRRRERDEKTHYVRGS